MHASKITQKIPVGILGATGMVGQYFIHLLENHPWFQVKCVAASPRSAGQSYESAVKDRWVFQNIPESVAGLKVLDVQKDMETLAEQVSFVFSAMKMDKEATRLAEEAYAGAGIPVVSNNSAHRWTHDVPMIIPEINAHHLELIGHQKESRGWDRGFIVVKPNCSIQSYVPVLHALRSFGLDTVIVATYQAVSGAGRTLSSWPEMSDNIIPFIPGEEKKSEIEPLKIWGSVQNGQMILATKPIISTTCIRVPVSDGHLVSVHARFNYKPTQDEIIKAIDSFEDPLKPLELPSSPGRLLTYFYEEDRPQTGIDRMLERGMGISIGRLRADPVLHWKFVALSHNMIRGAAGGGLLTAELLTRKGFISSPESKKTR